MEGDGTGGWEWGEEREGDVQFFSLSRSVNPKHLSDNAQMLS